MAQGIFRLSALTVAGIYLFLAFLFIWPLVDLAATGWPFQPGRLEWRYGFLGLMTAYWHTPILAVILSMFLSLILRHRKTFFGLSFLCLLWAAFLVVVLVLFPLDVIQLRSGTPEENRTMLMAGAFVSELKHLTAFLSVSLLAWGGWRTGKAIPKIGRGSETRELTAEVIKAQQRG